MLDFLDTDSEESKWSDEDASSTEGAKKSKPAKTTTTKHKKVEELVSKLKETMKEEKCSLEKVLTMLTEGEDSSSGLDDDEDDLWSSDDSDDYHFTKELRERVQAKRRTNNDSRSGSRGLPSPSSVISIDHSLDIYLYELGNLHVELNKLMVWVKAKSLKVAVIFEGRDAAGKGGCIAAISERLNPRQCKIAALPAPTDREATQWYFQRYIEHLPAAGEMVLFDRSWYNRAGVERVMGFCSDDEYNRFMKACPVFEEQMLQDNGIILIKYWLDIDRSVQEERFKSRLANPTKRWKLSAMDLESRSRWDKYSEARDAMFKATHTEASPWFVVNAGCKKLCRLNLIRHLLSRIPYETIPNTSLPKELPDVPEQFTTGNICSTDGCYIRTEAVYV